MFIVSHFSVPFYSYFLTNRFVKSHDNNKSLFITSFLVGMTGIIPDLINFHLTLAARHNSISHTIWFPLLFFIICSGVILTIKTIRNSLIFWLPFAISTHLFLDGISGGIRLFFPHTSIIGKYYLMPAWWGITDICFFLLLIVTYRISFKENRMIKAEQYN